MMSSKHPIKQSIEKIEAFHAKGDTSNRDYVNVTLSFLVKHLVEIEKNDKELLKNFMKKLVTCTSDTYYGIRMEISTSASLMRKNIQFKKTEQPDFLLYGDYNGISIECGSVHLARRKTTVKDLKYKIGSVIDRKSNSEYLNPSACLFIDITNISYYSTLDEIFLGSPKLKSYVTEKIKDLSLGSVLLWDFILNKDLKRYEWNYHRIDTPNATSRVVTFLDELYPFGHHIIKKWGFMKIG